MKEKRFIVEMYLDGDEETYIVRELSLSSNVPPVFVGVTRSSDKLSYLFNSLQK